jgi:type I restriction enzyme S subunit
LQAVTPNGIPFFRGKEISLLKNNQIPEDILYISNEHYKEIKEKYGVPEIGDILITAVGTLGNVYCIRNSNKFYFKDGNLIWMKNISENSIFLEILLNVKSKDILSSAIGSSQKALTMAELNKLTFSYPKKEEQQKIADCLSSIDELITAQTQKLDGLKTHKKGLMQQLFPAEGETVPELRFPEFMDSGEWEIKPLDSLLTIGNGKDYKHLSKGDIPVYGSGGYMLSFV